MLNVTINRKRWTRGNTSGDSALRTETGQSCCLGFVARACGITTPVHSFIFSELNEEKFNLLPKGLRPVRKAGEYVNTQLHDDLVSVNDSYDVRGAVREEKIAKLMKKANIKVKFV